MIRRRVDLARARRAAGLTQEQLAQRVGVDRSTVGRWEAGVVDPTPWARRELALVLDIAPSTIGELLGDGAGRSPQPTSRTEVVPAGVVDLPLDEPDAERPDTDTDDAIDAMELARRVGASDIGDATLTRLEQIVDELAVAYTTVPPAENLSRLRLHLRYVANLLDVRKTLAEHRRLLVVGGWLSLLAGTVHIDLEQHAAAVARIRTARALADECGHAELASCTVETRAWRALTLGDFREAASLSRAAQELAEPGSSAHVQAVGQEGRALARIGDTRAATAVVSRVGQLAEPLPRPDHPEHHFRYDLVKAASYTATTLTWIADPAAAEHARRVVADLATGDAGSGRLRRLALARLDLALALLRGGEVEEAVDVVLAAMRSGRLTAADLWRAREVADEVAGTGSQVARQVREAYQELRTAAAGRGIA